ncbi:MAG: thiamine diphosphokinase [Armatimonadetes bacterium]|nr:thiamine diphosphokinase [Armatimonadota bacterium]
MRAGTVLILAHGEPPPEALLRRWAAAADWFVCTDGAIDAALQFGVQPNAVLGDFDSLPPALPPTVERLHITEQETTDLEKAFYTAAARGFERVVVLGAGGGRWDQFYSNLCVMARYADRFAIEAGDFHGWLRLLSPRHYHQLDLPPGRKVSLVPLPQATGVTFQGVRWPLTAATLALDGASGISNEVTTTATLHYQAGCLGVYEVHE